MSHTKVAIMTGTGQGIGAGCAREMAKAGYKVSLMSPSNRSVDLAEELGGIGRRGSVLDVDDLQAMVDDTMSKYGRIDAVVSNMGHGGTVPEAIKTVGFDPDFDGPLLELTDELWHESLDMYVLNVVRLARIATPIMIEQGDGAFVNISSMNTIEPRAPYPMSMLRAALHSFSKLYGDRYTAPRQVTIPHKSTCRPSILDGRRSSITRTAILDFQSSSRSPSPDMQGV